jgi:hypothetical protein
MTKGDVSRYTFLGRPIKPLALALAMSMATIFWFNIVESTGILVSTMAGDIVGYSAGASAVVLLAGWWGRSQMLAETGLLIGSGVWVARTALIALLDQWATYSFFFSLAWCVVSVGAYLLEAFDPSSRRA